MLLQPPEEWTGGVGFVSKEMIQTHCPAPASDIKVWLKLQIGYQLSKTFLEGKKLSKSLYKTIKYFKMTCRF